MNGSESTTGIDSEIMEFYKFKCPDENFMKNAFLTPNKYVEIYGFGCSASDSDLYGFDSPDNTS